MVFQSVLDANGKLGGLARSTRHFLTPPYADAARIHTNSWGAPTGGDDNPYSGYTANARELDEYLWLHKDLTLLASAGNDGVDDDGDGVINPDSIGDPAVSKNVITVGATENMRSSGGYQFTWGEYSRTHYPARPISIDKISDDARGLAAFSSRGPTDDGRIKPDVAAPGTNIISARSSRYDSQGWGIYNSDYLYLGGTSMATPLTAGAAALIRERYVRLQGWLYPSAALIKATLINSAEHIPAGQYARGPCQEIPEAHPNNVAGWGRVNLRDSIVATPPRWIAFEDRAAGLWTGQTVSYDVNLTTGEKHGLTVFTPLSLSLASDTPLLGGEEERISSPQWGEQGERQVPHTDTAGLGATCREYIVNGGFENGLNGWKTQGNIWLSSYAHSGSYSGALGGYNNADDWLWQTLSIPADARQVTVSFWYDQSTEEPLCRYDYFYVGFYSSDWQTILQELLYRDGRAWTQVWERWEFRLNEEQLSAIRGKTVHLSFMMGTDREKPSSTDVDDVSVLICTGNSPPPPDPLGVTLVWTDYPGATEAAKALVNDLDLEVIAPNGKRYYGNGGTQPDRLDPTEDVFIQYPLPGRYQVFVRGYNVPAGPQPYAIVFSGGTTWYAPTNFVRLPLLIKNRRR